MGEHEPVVVTHREAGHPNTGQCGDLGRRQLVRTRSDAGLTDPRDVHLVMVKVPGLTTASIKDAESRGKTVVSHDLTFGPEGAGVYANDAAALGVAMALVRCRSRHFRMPWCAATGASTQRSQ